MDIAGIASLAVAVSVGTLAFPVVRTAARNACRKAWSEQVRFRARSVAATETAAVHTAIDAITARQICGGRPLTLIEIGVSPRDFRRLSARSDSIQNLVNVAASLGQQGGVRHSAALDSNRRVSDVRVWLREAPQVRRGHALLNSVDDGDRTTSFPNCDADTSFDAPAARAFLRSSNGTYELVGAIVFIGRARTNGIVLHNPRVSAHHATITRSQEGWTVTDHSSNGTWVDGRRLQRDQVHSATTEARIRLADQDFVLEMST